MELVLLVCSLTVAGFVLVLRSHRPGPRTDRAASSTAGPTAVPTAVPADGPTAAPAADAAVAPAGGRAVGPSVAPRAGRWAAAWSWVLLAACCMTVAGAASVQDFGSDDGLRKSLPDASTEGGFVTSAACRACHPSEYHSWHRSFHRTMTQPVRKGVGNGVGNGAGNGAGNRPGNVVLGDFDDVQLEDRGRATRLFRADGEYWAQMVDPGWFATPADRRSATPERGRFRVVMTTGSHHLQTYWVRRPKVRDGDPEDGLLLQLPFVWLIAEKRWAPTQDSFLSPRRDEPQMLTPWITSCNMCHSVATRPRLDAKADESASAELGIACEACHGPGAEHVRANLSPLRRYAQHFRGSADPAPDPTIVNPARLPKERAAEVCGQCHSFNKELDMARWRESGVAYRAGDVLGATKGVFQYTEKPTHPRLLEHLKAEPDAIHGRFWRDGTIRVAGREYNGLIESRCYTEGDMTCLSCHSLHGYADRQDQLAPDHQGDRSCLQCHADQAADIPAHTHHAADSTGSRCMNCHMPYTTFGLFTAMRSHRVDSPSAAVTHRTGRPNACNLCHLDRTLQWTAQRLLEWYGQAAVDLSADERNVASSVLMVTAGDGAQRAITAWAMGWSAAVEASGRGWEGAFLAGLLADPYAVTRQVAYRSLRRLPGFGSFEFDYLAPPDTLVHESRTAFRTWYRRASKRLDRHGPHVLMRSDAHFDAAERDRLLRNRDNRPIRIIE